MRHQENDYRIENIESRRHHEARGETGIADKKKNPL